MLSLHAPRHSFRLIDVSSRDNVMLTNDVTLPFIHHAWPIASVPSHRSILYNHHRQNTILNRSTDNSHLDAITSRMHELSWLNLAICLYCGPPLCLTRPIP